MRILTEETNNDEEQWEPVAGRRTSAGFTYEGEFTPVTGKVTPLARVTGRVLQTIEHTQIKEIPVIWGKQCECNTCM